MSAAVAIVLVGGIVAGRMMGCGGKSDGIPSLCGGL